MWSLLVLDSDISSKNTDSFICKWCLEMKKWVLVVLIAAELKMVLGLLSGQS